MRFIADLPLPLKNSSEMSRRQRTPVQNRGKLKRRVWVREGDVVLVSRARVAKFLVRWAIRKQDDLVLDASAGEGVFIQESIQRLRELGASGRKNLCSNI